MTDRRTDRAFKQILACVRSCPLPDPARATAKGRREKPSAQGNPGVRSGDGRTCRVCRRYRHLREEHERLLRQMNLAEQVQRSLLPHPLPSMPGVRFASGYRPTEHMAGDFLSVFRLDRHRVGFYVGDVMGHGPAAALLSVFAMLSLRTKRIDGSSYEVLRPACALEQLNRSLIEADLPDQPFVTMVYGVLDTSAHTWTYCSGGHPHPMLIRDGAPPVALDPTAPLLGVFDLPFHDQEVSLQAGDRLVLYSDGVLAARWGQQEGLDGLMSRLQPHQQQPVQTLIDRAMASLHFDTLMADDVAVLVAEITE